MSVESITAVHNHSYKATVVCTRSRPKILVKKRPKKGVCPASKPVILPMVRISVFQSMYTVHFTTEYFISMYTISLILKN